MSKQFDEYLLKEMQEDDDHDLVFSPENVEEDQMIDNLATTTSLQENMDALFPLHENDEDGENSDEFEPDTTVDDIVNGDGLDSAIDADITDDDILAAENEPEEDGDESNV